MTRRSPVGFTKYTLATVRGWTLRLHIWHGEGSEWPHNHRWPFWALPLAGRFTDTEWTLRHGIDQPFTHRKLAAHRPAPDQPHRYRRTGEIRTLTVWERRTRWPLVPYRCPLGVTHSAAPKGRGPHVTLVLHGPARSKTTTVWQPIEEDP